MWELGVCGGTWGGEGGRIEWEYRLNMSLIISTSVSALAIFSAEESWGRPPPKRKDIFWGMEYPVEELWKFCGSGSGVRDLEI